MAELASSLDMVDAPRSPGTSRLRRWLAAITPVVSVFVVLVALWYAGAVYFNLQYLNVHERDVNAAGWARESFTQKLADSLTTSQPTLPTPTQTIGDFAQRLTGESNGQSDMWVDLLWTGRAAFFGFLLGSAIAIVLAVLFLSSGLLARSLLPYVIASQTIPIVALVPPIMLVLGLGLRSEVLIAAYLAFFSVTISTYKGLLSVEPLALELMRSYAARPWQVFFKVRLPSALPFLFTGMKIGVTASLVGAIIAELPSGSPHGLGQSLLAASEYTDNVWLWSTMLAASCLGLILYGLVVLSERLIVRWRVEETA